MASCDVRLLRAGDLDEVARTCFPDNRAEEIVERLTDELTLQAEERGWTLVAEEAGAVCGTLHLERFRNRGWVHNVAVRADRRGEGIAGRLLDAAIDIARRAGLQSVALHVRRDNSAAVRAYEKAGFRFDRTDGMRGDQLRYRRRLNA